MHHHGEASERGRGVEVRTAVHVVRRARAVAAGWQLMYN